MEIKLLSCPLCLKPHFSGVESLRSTLINVATTRLKCPVCDDYFLGLDKLTIHLFSHINETNRSEREINESIESVRLESSNTNSTNNNNNNNNNNTNAIRCDICNFTFTDHAILEMHQKLLHQTVADKNTGLYSYHCHLCSKKFRKRGSLMVHLRVAHYGFVQQNIVLDNPPPSVGGASAPESPMTISKKILDNNNKQWECEYCSKLFTTKYFLKKHKRLHTGEMPYLCAQCNKSFTFQQSYHKHMLYHSSEKPYTCSECGRAFKELSTLQNHQRIHSGERPFACETCGKKFRQRVSYLVHQRIHTGVMPYKCTACEKSFRYKVSQRSHKCPMNPPGDVVRVVDETDAASQKEIGQNTKCIMSVDYDTGSINFIAETVGGGEMPENEDLSPNISDTSQPDLFSMLLSPLLPEVESLCLTSSPPAISNSANEENFLITEESFKHLFYDSPNTK